MELIVGVEKVFELQCWSWLLELHVGVVVLDLECWSWNVGVGMLVLLMQWCSYSTPYQVGARVRHLLRCSFELAPFWVFMVLNKSTF